MLPLGLMFARASQTNSLQPETALESESYQAHLKHKLEEVKGFVKLRSPFRQNARKRTMIVKQRTECSFRVGDTIWLSIPTAGKLDPRWQGGTLDCAVSRSPVTLEIVNGRKRKIVHVNRILRGIQPQRADSCSTNGTSKQRCQLNLPLYSPRRSTKPECCSISSTSSTSTRSIAT